MEAAQRCRRECFGNNNNDHVCVCLKIVEDKCKFFKTPEEYEADKKMAEEMAKRPHILRTMSGVMYY